MIRPERFVGWCAEQDVTLFTGVPDSLLRHLNSCIMRSVPAGRHIIAANEGAAVAIAAGHYLRTAAPALVYLQNSGFGNMVNPLLSLADPDVYGIGMVAVIGWRGQAGVKDEPQHVKQGRIMEALLDALGLPWAILPRDEPEAERCLRDAIATAGKDSCPYLLLVRKDTFAAPDTPRDAADPAPAAGLPSREEAVIALAEAVGTDAAVVATTGMLSRELFEYRQRSGTDGSRDFLTVGSMGHASSIALGVALSEPDREVWCFDGDGALLMHLGSLAVIADHAPRNYFHVVFNNQVHDSVGGQPTSIRVVDIPALALALGYRHGAAIADLALLPDAVAGLRACGGPSLLEVRVHPGSRPDLGRPAQTPAEGKRIFMAALAPRA